MKPFPFHGCDEHFKPHIEKVLAGEYIIPWVPRYPPGAIVVDGGANVGAFTYWALTQLKASYVHAIEPCEAIREHLVANLTDAGLLDKVTVIPCAITTTDEHTVKLYNGSENSGMTSTNEALAGQSEKFTIAHTIRAANLPICHFLKMDIEGNEYEVIKEYKEYVCDPEFISFEYHNAADRLNLDYLLYQDYYLGDMNPVALDIASMNYVKRSTISVGDQNAMD